MIPDITLPEVKSHAQTARFYRQGNSDLVEIRFVGSKDTNVCKVTPDHMARFKNEWDAFCDGRPPAQRSGIALTELPTINETRAAEYIARNVHTLEELAALNDGQCQSLGHGTLTDRKGARALVMQRQMQLRESLQREVQQKSAAIGPVPAETYAGKSEIDVVKSEMAEIRTLLAALVEKQARPRGRPPKNKAAD